MLKFRHVITSVASCSLIGCVGDVNTVETNAAETLSSSLVCQPLDASDLIREALIYDGPSPAALRLDLLFSPDRKSAYISGFRPNCYLLIESTNGPLDQVRREAVFDTLFPNEWLASPVQEDAVHESLSQIKECYRNPDRYIFERLGDKNRNSLAYQSILGGGRERDTGVCGYLIEIRSPALFLKSSDDSVLVEFVESRFFVRFF